MRRLQALACIAIFASLMPSMQAFAQTRKINEEYDKLISAAEVVGALGTDLFGDQTNVYTGSTEFSAVDVSLPGNNALAVAIGRRFPIEDRNTLMGNRLFGDWDIDLPYLHGTFARSYEWQVYNAPRNNRCTASEALPPTVKNISGWFDGEEYWQGNSLHTPGGDQPMLQLGPNNTNRPTDGETYYWTTTQHWMFSCLPSMSRGTGQGFLARAPDGTKYRFDWLVSRPIASLKKADGTRAATLARVEVWILPTRVEDRFGNWVQYTYDSTNPRRLLQIQSNDGRLITLTYNAAGFVHTVSDQTRTWTYGYSGSSLTSVTLPDGSAWNFSLSALASAYIFYTGTNLCDGLANANLTTTFTGSLTHPSGATGTFTVRPTRHGRSYVPRSCVPLGPGDQYLWDPHEFDSLALINKQITGPGLPTYAWTFSYGPPNQSFADQCGACATTKTVEVTGPGGVYARHTFGNRFGDNEGKLLMVESGASPANIQRTETYGYITQPSGQPYPTPYGWNPSLRGDKTRSERLMPMQTKSIAQSGATFTWTANAFDEFAAPTSVTRSSSLGYSATDVTGYAHNTGLWVIGQTASVMDAATGAYQAQNNYEPATALLSSTYRFGQLQETLGYHADGNLNTVTDGRNKTTTLTNYYRGVPRSIAYPTGASESAVVNNIGRITSHTDEMGNTTTYGHDAMGRLASIVYPPDPQTSWHSTSLTFERVNSPEFNLPAGHWRLTRATGNARKITYYDGLWRAVLDREYDAGNVGATSRYTRRSFDHANRQTFASYPGTTDGLTSGTRTLYDSIGRVDYVEQDSELGVLTTNHEYLSGLRTRITNPRGFATTYAYQAFDEPSAQSPVLIEAPEGVTTSIHRNRYGAALSITRSGTYAGSPMNATRYFVYDTQQRLCKRIEPERGATVMDYDAAGNVAWSSSGLALPSTSSCDRSSVPSAERTVFGYDDMNRVLSIVYPAGTASVGYSYYADGAVQTATSDGSVWTYNYNSRRLLTTETLTIDARTFGFTHGYDSYGNDDSLTYPSGLVVTSGRNALGQPTQAGSFATGATYYPNGASSGFTYGNGIIHSLTQNARGMPLRRVDYGATTMLDDTYAYDPAGNVQSITDGLGVSTRTLGYDGLDRLTSAQATGLWGAASMSYDPLDNIRTYYIGARQHTHYYNAAQQLTDVRTANGTTVHTYAWDAQGNLAFRNSKPYLFDRANRLLTVTGLESYTYDAHGRRTRIERACNNAKRYPVYSKSGKLLHEFNAKTNTAIDYVYLNGRLLAQRTVANGGIATVTYLHTDALGSPTAESNSAGVLAKRTHYKPYGEPANDQYVSGVGFTGHAIDARTGLNYMQARYYDPVVGRFLSTDPAEVDFGGAANFNRHAYAANNPYRYVDPDGRAECSDACMRMRKLSDRQNDISTVSGGGQYRHSADSFVDEIRNFIKARRYGQSEFNIGDKPFDVIGGTPADRARVEADLRTIFQTPRGAQMLAHLEARRSFFFFKSDFVVDLTVVNNAYAYTGEDAIFVDPNFHPLIQTTIGLVPASTLRILAHELGHAAFGTRDDGPSRMNNVLQNENPIMRTLGQPERTRY